MDNNATARVTGFNHVAVITADLDRFIEFWTSVFGLELFLDETIPAFRHALLRVGPDGYLHTFELRDNRHAKGLSTVADRGHLDHFSLTVADAATFDAVCTRLVEVGATDGTILDFGPMHSCFFTDPDGMSAEMTVVFDPALRGLHSPWPLAVTIG